MKVHSLKSVQTLNISVHNAWQYFSTPLNLPVITPSWLGFQVVSDVPDRMYGGLMIEYTVTPLPLFKFKWLTEITHVREPYFFVDEQREGPFKLWHHQHFFEPSGSNCVVTDIVHYIMPFGVIGGAVHGFQVRKRLEEIFRFRRKKLTELFSSA